MAKKSANSTENFTPTSDDKSENFDYLAQSSDIYPEPEISSTDAISGDGIQEKPVSAPAEFSQMSVSKSVEWEATQTLRKSITDTPDTVRDAIQGLAAEVGKLEGKYEDSLFGIPDEADDNTVIVITPDWSFFRSLLAACTRFDSDTYEPGQWGNRKFTLLDVWCICYRVDFPATDKDIESQVKALVKKGILIKEGMGRWSANPILQMTADGLGITEKKLTKFAPKF